MPHSARTAARPANEPRSRHLTLEREDTRPQTFDGLVAFAQEEERAGRRETARASYEQALYRVSNTDEASRISNIIRWIARTHSVDGNAQAARDCLEAALAIAESFGDNAGVGHALNIQAVVSWQQGDLDDAERLYLLARHRAIQAGDAKLAAMTAQNLGVLANVRGDFAQAEEQYGASLAEYRSLGLTTDVCVALNNLGLLFIAQQRWEEAERVLLEGVQICELTGDVMTKTQLDINLAELWTARGEFVRAHGAVTKALNAAVQAGDGSAIGKATRLLGVIARETGNYEEAERHFLHAESVATARNELLLQAELARDRAALARRAGRNRDVLQQLNKAHRLFTQLRARADLADIGERVGSLEQEFVHVARRWGESIEAKDRYTQGHCQRVAELGCAIARKSGMDEASLFWFRIGALLHDVGKIIIPEEVLNKPGKLTDEEWTLMKSHTTAGVTMLADIEFPWDVRPMLESHHERWDGNGYPHNLKGEAIPLIARILSIADVYDALTSVRSYKRAWSHQETMDILRKDVGTVFDPQVFAWFEEVAVDWPDRIAHLTSTDAPVAPKPLDALAEIAVTDVDDLTGLPMRRTFRETSERMLDARRTTGRPAALIVIDVDHFKVVNDTFGHLQGDAVLRLVADQIRVNTRPNDFAGRYAGDEFVVVLPGTRLEDALVVAERIRESVATASFEHAGGPGGQFKVTLSVGVAVAPSHGETLEELFNSADDALYTAKRSGRNTVASASRAGAGKREVLLQGFVGRVPERERLRALFAGAASGSPHVAVLHGEAGVGKSTLIKQLGPDVGIRNGVMLQGQCIEANVGVPYGPWIDIVRAAHRAELVPPRTWRELGRLVPELGGVDVTPGSGGSQRVLLEDIEEYLQCATAARPLMVVLDDMQWADPASWDMAEFLLARLGDQRMLVCLNIRAEDMTATAESRLRRLSRSERCTEIALTRLSREDLAQWLRSSLGGQAPDDQLLDHVMRQSEGNALFAVQTVRALVEDGRLHHDGESWHADLTDAPALPRAINNLLARRVERLGRRHREILAQAAVMGREFDPEALIAASESDESDVHEALDVGLASAVLTTASRARMLSFTHALLTRALLEGINPLRLRRMHARAARALEAGGHRDPVVLAAHYDAAGLPAEAFRTAKEAATQAQSVYAFESAVEFLEMAHRNALTDDEKAQVQWTLAQVQESSGRLERAEHHCATVIDRLAGSAHTLGILGAARRLQQRLRLQRGAHTDEVRQVCEVLLTEARAAQQPEEEVALLVMLSTLLQRQGDSRASELLAREAVQAAERCGQRTVHADAMMRLGSVLLTSSPADAIPLYRRALDVFVSLDDRHGQLRCHINIGTASERAGNHPAAEASYATAMEIGRDIRANDLFGVASLNFGVLLHKTGKLARARVHFSDAQALFTSIGHEPFRLASLYNLAHLAHAQQEHAEALVMYEACIELAESLSDLVVQVGAVAGAGLVELGLGNHDAASLRHAKANQLARKGADGWFPGNEIREALSIRLMAVEQSTEVARAKLLDVLPQVERFSQYAALWLGAECAGLLRHEGAATTARERLLVQARALGYQPLVARLQEQGTLA